MAPARPPRRLGERAAALGVVAAILVGNIAITARTYALIDRTGGRGRWSDALTHFAREIDADASNVVVSFDWGFHEPLLFLTARVRPLEPIWSVPAFLTRGRPFVHAGDERHVYLVHDQPYDLFYLGPKLLRAARSLGRERVEIRPHLDREGVPAFYSIRVTEPHRLIYTGEFQIHFP